MAYDVAAVRALFPALTEGAAHFDGPGGSQTPMPVGDAVRDTLLSAISNRGTDTASARRADAVVVEAREAMADLLGADPRGIVFGRSATALTYDLSRALARTWQPGDEVIVTRLDHDSNIRPWVQAAEAIGAVVKWAGFEGDTGELHSREVTDLITERTRLVATSAASNLIGTKPPVCKIARAVHEVGALHWVDGVHATAHASVDLDALGVDFWTCSPYKFLGPHVGVVAAAPALLETLTMDKLLPSGDAVPERFELGTLPYELLAGTTAAVDVLAGLDPDAASSGMSRRERVLAGFAALEEHEHRLLTRLEAGLRELPGVRLHSNARKRTPTLLFTVEGRASADVSRALAERGVNAPAGHFYALEASRHLGLGDLGGVRVGLAPYTDDGDIDRLLTALAELL
ncbi:cysteine desulfurase family protein (TIGR01976 family) [Knoellia remsis]|uniref:Cysteine desulfurase family protein (TIGR01976 family) n=1 Tax=Knoellia remsis TaxID=407159 RepID=A0A2T0U4W8_9MICO|nr:cysteine desulfurase-like protein [Knoellia remsis]PRY52967.1 cysteine desulfurase family protein (TIGR01976 family) [Knoellia remsis]